MQKQARIVAICHPKGGVGKTTTTMILSAALAERGYGVLVADCDAQASASAWANAAPESKPFPAAVVNLSAYAGKVHREIQKQLDNYDFVVIDCPPGLDSLSPQSAILVADLVIVPLPPSPARNAASVAQFPLHHARPTQLADNAALGDAGSCPLRSRLPQTARRGSMSCLRR